MPNQQITERIYRTVITPFTLHYGAVDDALADEFINELAEFDEQTLAAGFRHVKRTCKGKAKLAHVIEGCDKFAAQTKKSEPMTAENAAKLPWNIADEKAITLLKTYIENFAKTPIFLQAMAEGWRIYLQRYVYESAYLQAQWIAGIKNKGWLHSNVFLPADPTDEQMRDYLAEQKCQADTGVIDVGIPAGRIDVWKSLIRKPEEMTA